MRPPDERGAFLEREVELARLAELITQAREGAGGAVLFEGPWGIGRTRMLDEVASRARRAGLRVLAARGAALERDHALGVARQLLEPALGGPGAARDHPPAELSRPLGGPAGPAAARDPAGPEALQALLGVVRRLAGAGPLLLAVDDIHQADDGSARFVSFLARRIRDLPALLVLSAPPAQGELAEEIASDPAVEVQPLRPLSFAGVARLVSQAWGREGDEMFCRACARVTGGNPLLVAELLGELVGAGVGPEAGAVDRVARSCPPGLMRALALRLGRLDPEAVALARALAVLGADGGPDEAARLAGLSPERAARATDLLVACDVLSTGSPPAFRHPVLRTAMHASIPPGEAQRAHGRAARLIAESGAARERVASQLMGAAPAGDPWAGDVLAQTAAAALAAGRPRAAVAVLRRALLEPPVPGRLGDVLRDLGTAQVHAADGEGLAHLRRGLDLPGEPAELARAAGELALARALAGDAAGACRALQRTANRLAEERPDLRAGLDALVGAYAAFDPLTAVSRAGAGGPALAPDAGPLGGAWAAVREACRAASAARAGGLLEAALQRLREPGRPGPELTGPVVWLAAGLLDAERPAALDALLDAAMEAARGRGSALLEAFARCWRARSALRQGDVPAAEADARAAVAVLAPRPWTVAGALATGVLVDALLERGRVEEADHVLASRLPHGPLHPGPVQDSVLHGRGRLRLAQGRPQEALEDLLRYGRRNRAWGMTSPLASRHRCDAARALAALGRREEALALAGEDLRDARAWGAGAGTAIALRTLGLLEGADAGLERLQEAAALLESSPARLELARALAELGAALRRRNRRREAREPLLAAEELARACGAHDLLRRVEEELLATGAGPRTPAATGGAASLTASERRVAELAARGHSNPEIAQALFVSRKTVEKHLSNAYLKLDIESRGQLAAALEVEGAARP